MEGPAPFGQWPPGRLRDAGDRDAILYQGRTGCQWTYLPHDLPPKSATYYYFAAWRDDGTDQVIHELLRCQVREKARRLEDPTLVVLDTQSVHVAAGVPASTTGRDAGKRVPGRKRGLAVDVLGLVIAVIVLAASTHDNAAGIALLDQAARHAGGTVRKALVDQGFKNQVVLHGAGMGIDVEIVERNPRDKGFVPQPKRWRVEQTYGILILHRRLVRDYEHHPSSPASRVYWAMTHVMARRLTDATTPTWRDPQAVTARTSSPCPKHSTSRKTRPGPRPTISARRPKSYRPHCGRPRPTSSTSRSPERPSAPSQSTPRLENTQPPGIPRRWCHRPRRPGV